MLHVCIKIANSTEILMHFSCIIDEFYNVYFEDFLLYCSTHQILIHLYLASKKYIKNVFVLVISFISFSFHLIKERECMYVKFRYQRAFLKK